MNRVLAVWERMQPGLSWPLDWLRQKSSHYWTIPNACFG